MLVRTTKGVEVFYDEFQIVPNDKDGDLSNIITFAPENVQTEPDKSEKGGNGLILILSIVGGAILLAAVATVSVIFIKKRKKA